MLHVNELFLLCWNSTVELSIAMFLVLLHTPVNWHLPYIQAHILAGLTKTIGFKPFYLVFENTVLDIL